MPAMPAFDLHIHAPTTRSSPQLNIRTSDARLRYILRTEALRRGLTLSEYITSILWNALDAAGTTREYEAIFGRRSDEEIP